MYSSRVSNMSVNEKQKWKMKKERKKLTDLNVTFRLNGEASPSNFSVVEYHSS